MPYRFWGLLDSCLAAKVLDAGLHKKFVAPNELYVRYFRKPVDGRLAIQQTAEPLSGISSDT